MVLWAMRGTQRLSPYILWAARTPSSVPFFVGHTVPKALLCSAQSRTPMEPRALRKRAETGGNFAFSERQPHSD